MSFNKITVVGNLGKDPELNYTGQGKAVCHISVATSEKRRDKTGELQEVTIWFRITLWGTQAETVARYLTKGSPIYVEGRMRVEEWTDRDGKDRYTLEVQATDMQFIGNNANGSDDARTLKAQAATANNGGGNNQRKIELDEGASNFGKTAPSDDDIPF